jgi:hypothetical protein
MEEKLLPINIIGDLFQQRFPNPLFAPTGQSTAQLQSTIGCPAGLARVTLLLAWQKIFDALPLVVWQ